MTSIIAVVTNRLNTKDEASSFQIAVSLTELSGGKIERNASKCVWSRAVSRPTVITTTHAF